MGVTVQFHRVPVMRRAVAGDGDAVAEVERADGLAHGVATEHHRLDQKRFGICG